MNTIRRSAGLVATLAPVATAKNRLIAIVVVHAGDPATESTAHLAREEILASTLASWVGPLGGHEGDHVHEGLVDSLEPVVTEANLAQVDAVQRDVAGRRVFDADVGRDGRVAGPCGP